MGSDPVAKIGRHGLNRNFPGKTYCIPYLSCRLPDAIPYFKKSKYGGASLDNAHCPIPRGYVLLPLQIRLFIQASNGLRNTCGNQLIFNQEKLDHASTYLLGQAGTGS